MKENLAREREDNDKNPRDAAIKCKHNRRPW
jgi:hypothetical protein